jgi:hypothetical protein
MQFPLNKVQKALHLRLINFHSLLVAFGAETLAPFHHSNLDFSQSQSSASFSLSFPFTAFLFQDRVDIFMSASEGKIDLKSFFSLVFFLQGKRNKSSELLPRI